MHPPFSPSTRLLCSMTFLKTTQESKSDVDLMEDCLTHHAFEQDDKPQNTNDAAAPSSTEEELQISTNNFHQAYNNFGLRVNVAKTKVLAQPILFPTSEVFCPQMGNQT